MSSPLAFLLTWTCYGTWLPGDERGSIREIPNLGTRLEPPNRGMVHDAMKNLKAPLLRLSDPMRTVIDDAIRRHCTQREWRLYELAVRTNHVHAVVSGTARPEVMIGQFKAWSTRRLREESLVDGGRPVWTQHASTRYLNTEAALLAAVEYVRDQ